MLTQNIEMEIYMYFFELKLINYNSEKVYNTVRSKKAFDYFMKT